MKDDIPNIAPFYFKTLFSLLFNLDLRVKYYVIIKLKNFITKK